MQKGKKLLSLLLTFVMLFTTLCFFSPDFGAEANAATGDNDVAFYVPEVIYLMPNAQSWTAKTTSTFQYFVENTVNTSDIYATPTINANGDSELRTVGHLYFAAKDWADPNADLNITVRNLKIDGTTVISTEVPKTDNYKKNSTYHSFDITQATTSPELEAGENGYYIEWICSWKATTGELKSAVAYTYVYKPYVIPVGAAVNIEAKRASASNSLYSQHISWISGVHGINGTADYAPNYLSSASGKGMLGFLSKGNSAVANSTEISGTTAKHGDMYAVFASTTAANSYFYAGQTNSAIGNSNVTDWLGNNSNFGVKSFGYFSNSGNPNTVGQGYREGFAVSAATGNIFIDTSRYKNLNQIPNLGVGLMVTDNAGGQTGAWYVADFTDKTDGKTSHNNAGSGTGNAASFTAKGDYIAYELSAANASNASASLSSSYVGTGLKFAGTWNKTLKAAESATYSIKGYHGTYSKPSSVTYARYAYTYSFVDLKATQIDKSKLREAVDNAISKFAEFGVRGDFGSHYYDVSSTEWKNFVSAYNAAAMGLTRLDASCDAQALANALNNAVSALEAVKTRRYYFFDVNYDGIRPNLYIANEAGSTMNGLTATYNSADESYTLKGELTSDTTFGRTPFSPGPSKYTLTFDYISGNLTGPANLGCVVIDAEDVAAGVRPTPRANFDNRGTSDNYKTIDFSASSIWSMVDMAAFWVWKYDGLTANNYTFRYKIEEGDTATAYSPAGRIAENGKYDTLPRLSDREGFRFIGWSTTPDGKTAVDVNTDVTSSVLYAIWQPLYTITWKNADGTVLETDYNVPEGTTPVYNGSTPTKAADEQYSYTFAGWDKTVVPAAGHTVYTATYTNKLNSYSIIWLDDAGNLIDTTTVEYGKTPAHADPTKASTAEYTYTFTGWTPELKPVTGAATYRATFSSEKNKYTITWLDEDGSLIDTTEVEYGTVPTHAEPTKEADEQYSYTFNGWTPALKSVTGEATYQATYKSTVNKYTVTWMGDNNQVLKTEEVEYGTVPSYTGATPEKQGDDQYSYTFSGWDKPFAAVKGDVTYTAQFDSSVNKYTVEWVDGDGNVLLSEQLEYGKTPSYTGTTPTMTATDQYTYEFNGTWSPEIVKVTGNATYTAQFSSTVNEYTVTWVDDNNAVLETDENVPYGTMPTFDGKEPTKVSNQQYSFTFAGWTPEVSEVKGDVTYRATYKTELRKYTVEWIDGNGNVIKTDEVAYGDTPAYSGSTPTKTATAQYTYNFIYWDLDAYPVAGNQTYTAVFEEILNKYTVTWVDEDGTTVLETDENVPYGTTPTFDGEKPTKESTEQYDYSFAGWSPDVSEVTGEVTYTATYVETVKSYKVTWKNYDGAVIKTDDVLYGVTPEYKGETPVRPDDEQKTYTFSGWTPEISAVTSDAEYTATYTDSPRKYTVTFKFANGNTVEKIYVYGTLAEAIECPENTTREPDAENHYSYEWPEMKAVTEAVTYEEIETKTAHAYDYENGKLTRPVLNDGVWSDGYYTYTCNVGDAPHTKTETVKRADYSEYTEALNKLKELLDEDLPDTDKAVINSVIAENTVVDDLIVSEQDTVDDATANLKVTFDEMSLHLVKFTVTFVVNGNIVKEEKVIDGKNATAPADPADYYDDENHYTFVKWDKAFTNVKEAITVTAEFASEEHNFTKHTDLNDDYHTVECSCGYTKEVEHSYDDGEVTKAPTCSATGERTKTCTLCGGEKIVVEPIDENAHEAAAEYIVTLAPTCTKKGEATYSCVYCNEVIETIELEIVEDAHKWETEYTVDAKASCFAPGSKSYHCEYCNGIKEDSKVVIAQRTHDIVDVDVHTEATCIATGIMNQKCNHGASDEYEACTYTTTRVIEKDPDNHTTDETYVDGYKAPTCTTPGATGDTKHKCCNAVKIESVEIPVDENAHTGKADLIKNYKAATCYSEGYTGDIYWSCCDKLYAEGKVTEKTAHTPADAVIENKVLATATKAGSYEEVIYCSVAACHFEISRTLKTYTIYDVLPGLPESGKLSIDLDENGESKVTLDDILSADANYKTLYNEITVDAEGKIEAEDDCEVVITVTATTGETVDITVTVRTPKTITFIMKDKTVTLTAYNGDRLTNAQIPTVESIETEEFTYTFKSWSPVITVVADDTTYTAIYTEPCDYDEFDRLSGIFNEIIGGLVDDSVLESNKEIIDELLIEIAQINDGRKTRDESEQPVVDAVVEKLDELVISIYPDAGSTLEIIGSAMHYLGTVIDLKVMKMPLGTLVTDAEWTSSDENVVFFSDGKLYAFGTGTATVTATKGLLTVSKKITVVAGGNTRSINFTAVDLTVTFLIEGFRPFYDTTLLYWSDDTELRFRIDVYANPVFRNHVVYFNDEEVFPDENSYYVIPAGSGDIRVVVAGELYEDPGEEKDPVTKWSLWDWILDFFRKIGDFFRNLFS